MFSFTSFLASLFKQIFLTDIITDKANIAFFMDNATIHTAKIV